MDNICKAYVSQVKAILPVWGKKEKSFVKKLHCDLCDYCEYNNINSIEELYKKHGTPQEIVFEYVSLMEPEAISKRINTAKFIRVLIISLLILATIVTSIICITIYSEYQAFKNCEAIGMETVVTE